MQVIFGNGERLAAQGTGSVSLEGKYGTIVATDVLWVPNLVGNLFSLPVALKKGVDCHASGSSMVLSRQGEPLLSATEQNGLIWLDLTPESTTTLLHSHVACSARALELHRLFGHVGFKTLADMVNLGLISTDVTPVELKQAGTDRPHL